jgi:hypothetical protein
MKKMMLVLPALVLTGLFACKPAMLRKYAIKDPQIETLESIRSDLLCYSPSYPASLCVFRDSAALVDWFKNKNLPGRSQFYNSTGYRIITQDSTFCSGVETDFAGNLKISQSYKIDSMMTFDKLKRNLMPVGEKVDLNPSKYAFTCVIFWARFLGKLNESSFHIAAAALKSQPAEAGKVNVLFVDMDILDFWNSSGKMIRTEIKAR